MDITELINKEQICMELHGDTKEEVICELVDAIDKSNNLHDKNIYLSDVIKREGEISTGIGNEIAIPHGKSKGVKNASLAFGVSKKGIDFKSFDEKLVHLIFLIAVPEDSNNLHLKVLSQLSRKLMHPEFRHKLKNANTKEEILLILNGESEG
ncbi:PTS sugar transporter subunit IIA [Abyssisolibacter fermentans]|uniref:PTS sugar transporter subunit IIA n=1 Tax=Abyssisolibacter fermentans TaxID=1766203 RepID=UPI00082C8EB3|nr:PTS sugar transporter subunit IIA [Abyssisolibacter fermentans]